MEKNKQSSASSPLASAGAAVLWLGLSILCTVAEFRLLAGTFLFLFLLSGSAWLWGRRAMKGVSVEARCDTRQLFPGGETEIRYTVKNDKLLPLIWLELSQDAPERNCLTPDECFERYTYPDPDGAGAPPREALRRTFSFVMSYETLTLSSRWTARRRGIYKPERLLLRSGDGFGLTQMERLCPAEKLPELVVCPRPVGVDVSLFLRCDWERSAGASGLAEDTSVLRGLRPYQTTDSWKRINWRMAARQTEELKVNFYETVQPVMALFLLDGESFCGLDDGLSALEEALEILASVLRELFSRGVACGLCLPESRRFGPVSLPPGQERSASELLYYLAGYDCLAEPLRNRDGEPAGGFSPSRFDLAGAASAAGAAGLISVITFDPDGLPPRLMERLGPGTVTVFSAGRTACADTQMRLLPLARLRKEGGR